MASHFASLFEKPNKDEMSNIFRTHFNTEAKESKHQGTPLGW